VDFNNKPPWVIWSLPNSFTIIIEAQLPLRLSCKILSLIKECNSITQRAITIYLTRAVERYFDFRARRTSPCNLNLKSQIPNTIKKKCNPPWRRWEGIVVPISYFPILYHFPCHLTWRGEPGNEVAEKISFKFIFFIIALHQKLRWNLQLIMIQVYKPTTPIFVLYFSQSYLIQRLISTTTWMVM
jgi:hypothetical protein